jgi:hypothetical protein
MPELAETMALQSVTFLAQVERFVATKEPSHCSPSSRIPLPQTAQSMSLAPLPPMATRQQPSCEAAEGVLSENVQAALQAAALPA